MSDQINIQVRFSRDYNGMQYSDALYFTQEEYAALTPAQLTALEDQRFNAWVTHIENPPPPPPTPPKSRIYSKFGFRGLFTLEEQIAMDNSDVMPLPDEAKQVMRTLRTNFQVADEIDLDDSMTQLGVQKLEEFGLIGPGRAAEILS